MTKISTAAGAEARVLDGLRAELQASAGVFIAQTAWDAMTIEQRDDWVIQQILRLFEAKSGTASATPVAPEPPVDPAAPQRPLDA